jgi:hypothetical protein
MLLAKLSRSLTKTQLIDLATYLQSLTKTHISLNSHITALCKNVPTRVSDFRHLYTDGKHSVSQNVPKPVSIMLQFHSYVSITDCLADFVARNTNPICTVEQVKSYNEEERHSVNNIFNSNAASKVISNLNSRLQDYPNVMKFDVIPCLLYLWSDNFDPINSIKKIDKAYGS